MIIGVDNGNVERSGIVVDERESQACESVVARVPGFSKVANALKTISGPEALRRDLE